MQITNDVTTDGGRLLSGPIQPVEHGVNFAVFDSADRAQTVALHQHGDNLHQDLSWGTHGFKECTLVSTERALAGDAVKASFSKAVNFDVGGAHPAEIRAGFVITPVSLSVHHASFLLA